MNFLEYYNGKIYIYSDDIDSDDADMAYKMAKKHGISVLSDKDLYAIIKMNDEVAAALWTTWNYEEYSFDIVVNNKYQGIGLAKELVDIVINNFNQDKEAFGDEAIIRADVINPKMEKILLSKGFEVESKSPGHTMMVRK